VLARLQAIEGAQYVTPPSVIASFLCRGEETHSLFTLVILVPWHRFESDANIVTSVPQVFVS